MPARKKVPGHKRVHGDVKKGSQGAFAQVHDIVRSIPSGKVMTYGQISRQLEHRLSPVAVGWALHGCPEDVPWQRVVNASGGCSTDRLGSFPPGYQKTLLEQEGVVFAENDTLDLAQYQWVDQTSP